MLIFEFYSLSSFTLNMNIECVMMVAAKRTLFFFFFGLTGGGSQGHNGVHIVGRFFHKRRV